MTEPTWQRYLTDYNEGLGLVYERFVLNDFLSALRREYNLQTVLEAPLLMADEPGGQAKLSPDPLYGGQPLAVVVHQGHLGAGLGQGHTVDARYAGHAKEWGLKHGLEVVLAP